MRYRLAALKSKHRTAMELKRLDPSLRRNLKDLLDGYLEHCQVSRHLMARIDFPIYYHGFKFGAPIFTHSDPRHEAEDQKVIGLLGVNTPDSQVPADILLQLIEILVQQPNLAEASILRVLPVANPVALELGEHAPALSDWPILEHLVSKFQAQSADGMLEVVVADEEYALEGSASVALFQTLEKITSPDGKKPFALQPDAIRLTPVSGGVPWHVRLSVPATWTESAKVHSVARFIARLIGAFTSRLDSSPDARNSQRA